MHKYKLSFDDVFDDYTSKCRKIKKDNYLLNGKYPIIDQGQNNIAGYANDNTNIFIDIPVIIFGDHTRIIKYIEYPFLLGADGVKVLYNKKKDIAFTKYLYYLLKNSKIPNTGYNRHFKWLKEIVILLPPVKEQKKIADTLDKINNLIDLRKQQLEKLDLLIKSKFIDMFGDLVTNSKKWGRYVLEELCDVRDGTHDSPKYIEKGKHALITSKNIKNGQLDFSNINYITDDDYNEINKRSKVDIGDMLMPMIGTIGNPIIIKEKVSFAIKNVALFKFNKTNQLKNIYLQYLLQSNFFEHITQQEIKGGTQKFFALKNIRKMTIPLPPINLQNKFEKFVETVEKQKELINKSLQKLDLIFKSLMQEYFG